MTVFGFVECVAVLKEWNDRDRRTREVRRVVDLVGLSDLTSKKIGKLSGGQRRRVGLAQSLLGDPGILVLDEPTTGLDPAQRADLRRTLSVVAGFLGWSSLYPFADLTAAGQGLWWTVGGAGAAACVAALRPGLGR